jgi:hypothetical protein
MRRLWRPLFDYKICGLVPMTASDVKSRFLAEQNSIQRHVDFLIEASQVRLSDLHDIVQSLDNLSIDLSSSLPVTQRRNLGAICSVDELKIFLENYEAAQPFINALKDRLVSELEAFPEPEQCRGRDLPE